MNFVYYIMADSAMFNEKKEVELEKNQIKSNDKIDSLKDSNNTGVSKEDNMVSNKVQDIPEEFSKVLFNFEFDALKETANIGTGNAAIALSNILKKKVNIGFPELKILKLSEASKTISFPEGMVLGIYSKMQQEFEGSIITMMPFDTAQDIINLFYPEKKKSDNKKFEDNEKKLLIKIGTAIYLSYLSSLAKFFEKKIYFDPPNLVSSFGDSIFDFMSLGVDDSTNVLIIKLSFEIENTSIKGDFLLLLTINSLSILIQSLRKKV